MNFNGTQRWNVIMPETINNKLDSKSKISFEEMMYAFFRGHTEDNEAAKICKEKAEAGDYMAMLWLARMYRDGKGLRRNSSKAIDWYKQSRDNNIYSKFELLAMLSNQKPQFKKEDVPEGFDIDMRKEKNYSFIGLILKAWSS